MHTGYIYKRYEAVVNCFAVSALQRWWGNVHSVADKMGSGIVWIRGKRLKRESVDAMNESEKGAHC